MYFVQIIQIIYSKTSEKSKIIYFWMHIFLAEKNVVFFFKQMPCVKKTYFYTIFWNKLLYIYHIRTNIQVKYI